MSATLNIFDMSAPGECIISPRDSVSQVGSVCSSPGHPGSLVVAAVSGTRVGDAAAGCKDCYLCLLAISPDDQTRFWQGVELHIRCHNGVVCFFRLITKNTEVTAQYNKNMLRDPEKWRSSILPLVGTDEKPRDKAHMKMLKAQFVDTIVEDYNSKEHISNSKTRCDIIWFASDHMGCTYHDRLGQIA